MKLVLDTNVYCDYAEGVSDTIDFMVSHGEQFYLPSIILGELHFGFMKGRRQRFNERQLRQAINRLRREIGPGEWNKLHQRLVWRKIIYHGSSAPIPPAGVLHPCTPS